MLFSQELDTLSRDKLFEIINKKHSLDTTSVFYNLYIGKETRRIQESHSYIDGHIERKDSSRVKFKVVESKYLIERVSAFLGDALYFIITYNEDTKYYEEYFIHYDENVKLSKRLGIRNRNTIVWFDESLKNMTSIAQYSKNNIFESYYSYCCFDNLIYTKSTSITYRKVNYQYHRNW